MSVCTKLYCTPFSSFWDISLKNTTVSWNHGLTRVNWLHPLGTINAHIFPVVIFQYFYLDQHCGPTNQCNGRIAYIPTLSVPQANNSKDHTTAEFQTIFIFFCTATFFHVSEKLIHILYFAWNIFGVFFVCFFNK